MPLNKSRERRILDHVVVDQDSGCWLWQRPLSKDGYGTLRVDSKSWLAHRFSYTVFVGEIPDGLTLDHVVCHTRSCVNPWHTEPVTQRVNVKRGFHPNMMLHREQQCSKGHKIIGGNVSIRNDGRKRCRKCVNDSARARRAVA